MQALKSILTKCGMRTSLNLCQQLFKQQQYQPLLQQECSLSHNLLWQIIQTRATATCATSVAAGATKELLLLQKQQQHHYHSRQLQQQKHSQSSSDSSCRSNRNCLLIPSSSICTSAAPLLHPIHPHDVAPQPLCEERAHELVFNLKDSEREAIKLALSKYDAITQKAGFEGKLAASQWRTRFGRPTKVLTLGQVDPTGSFCAFPDNWLKQKAAEKAKNPTQKELTTIFFVNAVPFVAFGFLDNFVMIIAGDQIENVLGTFMCVSTMAAAGLGNTVSDVLGIGSAFYVERACDFIGLRLPDITPVQMEMKSSRKSANWGRIVGITLGCLLGMSPLYFMKQKRTPTVPENEVLVEEAVVLASIATKPVIAEPIDTK